MMFEKRKIELAKQYTQKVINYAPEQMNAQEQEITAAFCFGVLNGFLMEKKLALPQFQAVMLYVMNKQLGYSLEASMQGYDHFASQMSVPNSTTRAIIHRGLDGYFQIKSRNEKEMGENLIDIFETVRNYEE